MLQSTRPWLILLALVGIAAAELRSKDKMTDPVSPLVPRQQPTRAEIDQREALKLYAHGLLCERDNRFLEATQSFEEAVRLDPDAAAPHRALIPLYLALNRTEDILSACKATLDSDPDDYETWHMYARQLKIQGQPREAINALDHALRCPSLKDQPDQYVQVAFDLGNLCEDNQEVDRALAAFTKGLEEARFVEEGGEVQARIAEAFVRVCLKASRHDRALSFCKELEKTGTTRDPIRAGRLNYYMAKICLAQDRPAEALKFLDDYLKTQPTGTEIYELKITLLKRLDRAAAILPTFEQYASRDPHNLALQLLLASQYAEQGQTERAKRLYLDLATRSPVPEVYRGLFALDKARDGGHEEILGQLDKAIGEATTRDRQPGDATAAVQARAMLVVLREDPELAKGLIKAAQDRLRQHLRLEQDTWRLLAAFAARVRQLESAEQFYLTLLAGPLNPQNEAEVYFSLVTILWESRKYDKIIEVCRKGLREAEATNRVYFHRHLAMALAQVGQGDKAIAEADQAVDLATDDTRLKMRLARVDVLRTTGHVDRASAECLALLKEASKPDEIRDIRYILSNVYSSGRELAKSEEQLRLILQADPNDATACNDLGYIMADHGQNLEEAELLIRKAIKLDRDQKKSVPASRGGIGTDDDQDNAAYVDSLGWVLFRRGRLEEARREMEKAVTLSGGNDDPVVWDHLGDVCFRMADRSAADKAWHKALALYEAEKGPKHDDQFKELKNKLRLLKSEAQP